MSKKTKARTEMKMSDHVQFLTQLLCIAAKKLGGSFVVTDDDIMALDLSEENQLSITGDEKHPDQIIVEVGKFDDSAADGVAVITQEPS